MDRPRLCAKSMQRWKGSLSSSRTSVGRAGRHRSRKNAPRSLQRAQDRPCSPHAQRFEGDARQAEHIACLRRQLGTHVPHRTLHPVHPKEGVARLVERLANASRLCHTADLDQTFLVSRHLIAPTPHTTDRKPAVADHARALLARVTYSASCQWGPPRRLHPLQGHHTIEKNICSGQIGDRFVSGRARVAHPGTSGHESTRASMPSTSRTPYAKPLRTSSSGTKPSYLSKRGTSPG